MKNELDQMIEETANEIIDSGRTVEDVSHGLAGLTTKESKPKKKYSPIMFEVDVVKQFKNVSKMMNATHSEMLRYMINKLHEEAQAEKDRRAEARKADK